MLFVIVPFMFGKLVGIMVRATFPLNSDFNSSSGTPPGGHRGGIRIWGRAIYPKLKNNCSLLSSIFNAQIWHFSDGPNNAIAGIASEWQLWAAWSHCMASCGKGLRMRARGCSKPDYGGNDTCPGNSTETQECTSAECAGNPQYL